MAGKVTFGEWLDDRLRERKWSQTSFAEFVDVSPSTVSTWISGTHDPGRRVVARIARALEVDVNEVLVRANYPPVTPDYVLPENRKEPERADVKPSERVTFFAANADKLSQEEWEALRILVERLVAEGEI